MKMKITKKSTNTSFISLNSSSSFKLFCNSSMSEFLRSIVDSALSKSCVRTSILFSSSETRSFNTFLSCSNLFWWVSTWEYWRVNNAQVFATSQFEIGYVSNTQNLPPLFSFFRYWKYFAPTSCSHSTTFSNFQLQRSIPYFELLTRFGSCIISVTENLLLKKTRIAYKEQHKCSIIKARRLWNTHT